MYALIIERIVILNISKDGKSVCSGQTKRQCGVNEGRSRLISCRARYIYSKK